MAQSAHMSTCEQLHALCRTLRRFKFPFDNKSLPRDGIYVLFENDEIGHNGERIVRVGSHTGEHQLPSRMTQHFLNENKDRSIFRKHIGRCLLVGTPYAATWEYDLTTRAMRDAHKSSIDADFQASVEHDVTALLRSTFSFVVFSVPDAKERLALEAAMIATVARCKNCHASATWLGKKSPVKQIKESGLWLVQNLDGTPLDDKGFATLERTGVR